ncbi:MAG TPA: hypothetical protein VLD36_16990 [Burkholderiales bacterium]|nr:hypothetical protein [Burkholderiales bacterium]
MRPGWTLLKSRRYASNARYEHTMLLNFIAAGRSAAGESDFSPEKMRAFLNTLPRNDPKRAARTLIVKLVELNRAELQGRQRLRLLDMVRDHVDWLLPQLEVRVAKVTPPLSAALREAAYCIEKVLEELAAGYTNAVAAAPRAFLSIGFKSQLHTPLRARWIFTPGASRSASACTHAAPAPCGPSCISSSASRVTGESPNVRRTRRAFRR